MNDSAIEIILKNSRRAFFELSTFPIKSKRKALREFSILIKKKSAFLLSENRKDLAAAESSNLSPVLKARLQLDESKLQQLVDGIMDISRQEDPVGKCHYIMELDRQLLLEKHSVPIGVIAVIFESRPDVIPQILALILMSGNAAVLKGGKEATHSNLAFMKLVAELKDLPQDWAQLIHERSEVHALLDYPQYVDLVIPRGSSELVRSIQNATKIPVLGHADGICHLYIDQKADLKMAVSIAIDAKCQYPSACNSIETLLLHQRGANQFLRSFLPEAQKNKILLKGCKRTLSLAGPHQQIQAASTADFGHEFGDLTLAIKIVDSLNEAIDHINQYGSRHTDAIVSRDRKAIEQFLSQVDSADVLANASTRFADGYRFGLGAEVGISTAKTHARGPVGIEGLMTYKYLLRGQGQIVADYVGKKAKKFKHRLIKNKKGRS